MPTTTAPAPHVHVHRTPSRTAMATRSLRLAERLREAGRIDEYRAALAEHFATYIYPQRSACPIHRPA